MPMLKKCASNVKFYQLARIGRCAVVINRNFHYTNFHHCSSSGTCSRISGNISFQQLLDILLRNFVKKFICIHFLQIFSGFSLKQHTKRMFLINKLTRNFSNPSDPFRGVDILLHSDPVHAEMGYLQSRARDEQAAVATHLKFYNRLRMTPRNLIKCEFKMLITVPGKHQKFSVTESETQFCNPTSLSIEILCSCRDDGPFVARAKKLPS